ncbi:hypothetical protein [Bowmanella dokdonensis]|uniref:Lipoprotein n=1 Tax=Bowmanella dokdonensis TaxID=751969 RepID=A0A939DMB5_9ALTE|nr:hypothetical protein [Bowmanella dokdonensis]MBN7824740.1 hypothetical protein [Bowmanella dokdonensis]
MINPVLWIKHFVFLVSMLLLAGCPTTDGTVRATVNTAMLGAAVLEFETSYLHTSAQIDRYRQAFSDEEWQVINNVRQDARRVHNAVKNILALDDGTGGAVVDISEFIHSLESVRYHYRQAYLLLERKVPYLEPALAQSLVTFHRATRTLDTAYRRLSEPHRDNTELIVQTLHVVGAGIRLFGV